MLPAFEHITLYYNNFYKGCFVLCGMKSLTNYVGVPLVVASLVAGCGCSDRGRIERLEGELAEMKAQAQAVIDQREEERLAEYGADFSELLGVWKEELPDNSPVDSYFAILPTQFKIKAKSKIDGSMINDVEDIRFPVLREGNRYIFNSAPGQSDVIITSFGRQSIEMISLSDEKEGRSPLRYRRVDLSSF